MASFEEVLCDHEDACTFPFHGPVIDLASGGSRMSGPTRMLERMTVQESHPREATIANPVRGRLNSAFFRLVDGYVHRRLGARKQALFADLPQQVVELGSGTGANLRYFRPGTHLIAIEPNAHMHPALLKGAAARSVSIDVRATGAEATGLPSASTDAVVCTLVLCTVPDPAAALAEVRRILRPGGQLLLIEHVAARRGTFMAALQHLLRRPWLWAFEGCDLERHTTDTIHAAGFSGVELERFRLRSLFLPVNEQLAGKAKVTAP
jgi:SAM-dependent methyltransferase